MSELKGQVALITGGSRGIGRAIALTFARHGAKIALNDLQLETLEVTAKEIEEAGGEVHCFPGDVSSFQKATEITEEVIKLYGKIDILVNNAGITKDNLLLRMKEEDWDKVLAINLKSVFNFTKAVLRYQLKQKYGRIINMASVIGLIGNSGQANYAASKAGVIGFTKAIAKEVAAKGITVNALAPGFINTSMTASLPEEIKAKMLSDIPVNRFGEAEEVAAVALFLVNAGYITGQVINIDGGMVM